MNAVFDSARRHWREYLIEAALLGAFMISACSFGVMLEHPASAVNRSIAYPPIRRLLAGAAMGLTALCIFYSPWGRRSGAHINPAVTVTFLRLRRIGPWDALFYAASQFAGAVAGVAVASAVWGAKLAESHVRYVVTTPGTAGAAGAAAAFAAELAITLVLMSVVLRVSSSARFTRFTGVCASAMVALYITFESPISGMSMNPARSFGSAAAAGYWQAQWIYFVAPLIGMLIAAEVFRLQGREAACAKIYHDHRIPCHLCAWRARRYGSAVVNSREPSVQKDGNSSQPAGI